MTSMWKRGIRRQYMAAAAAAACLPNDQRNAASWQVPLRPSSSGSPP